MSSKKRSLLQRLFNKTNEPIKLDKRRVEREALNIPVTATVSTRTINNAVAVNLSPLGLYVQASPAPPRGNVINLSFKNPVSKSPPVKIVGRVVWNSRTPKEGMGIEIDPRQTTAEALQQYRSMVLYYARKPVLDTLQDPVS
jgi:hypothetical protein